MNETLLKRQLADLVDVLGLTAVLRSLTVVCHDQASRLGLDGQNEREVKKWSEVAFGVQQAALAACKRKL